LILLNLLPHREVARKKKREQFIASLILATLGGLGAAVMAYSLLEIAISSQRNVNAAFGAEIKVLDQKISDIKGLQAQIESLQARQRAVEDVQSDRNQSVHLLTELVRQLPSGVLISKVSQMEQTVLIGGSAQTNDQVSEFLRNLGGQSLWLSKPELIETAAATVALTPKDVRPMFNFSIRAALTRDAQLAAPTAASTGSAPAAPAAAESPSTVSMSKPDSK
jgi:type IV pilus assembly protein PilN